MEITAFAVRVVLLFFPGIVCAYLLDVLVVHRTRTVAEFLIRAFTLGVTSYLALFAIAALWGVSFGGLPGMPRLDLGFFHVLDGGDVPLRWAEIAAAGGVAVGLAFPLAWCLNYKVVNRVAATLSVSQRSGDLDVWGYVWNSPDSAWVDVRDVDGDILYRGKVSVFSERGDAPQLYLEQVEVFRISSGESLYRTDGMFLALQRDRTIIDVHVKTPRKEA